ncbi:MAG: Uncharacterised protein [Flavobacterium sp. SCGC AAA160-P02]|nr:MAG: Uncharacterised protein [Flavobacterium sp. SCGC AAA160-P02]
MKKIILILTVMIAACNPSAEKTTNGQEGAGFFLPVEGEKYVVATDSVTDIWMNYIKAHNDGDLEAIMTMDSDSIIVEADDGRVIRGKEMHKAALADWFAAENPKWKVYWAMPYKAVNGGQEWIVAGHQVTTTVDGKKKVQLHMIDGEIKDGKIKQFYVYSKQIPEPPKTDSDSAE